MVAVFIPPITPAIAIAELSSAITSVFSLSETVCPFNSSSFSFFFADLTSIPPLIVFKSKACIGWPSSNKT